MARIPLQLPVETSRVVDGPLTEAEALTELTNDPVGFRLYEATDAADPDTIYAEWVKADV